MRRKSRCLRTDTILRIGSLIGGALSPLPGLAGDRNGEEPLSPFGIGSCHANSISMEANARWVPQMTSIGVRVYRGGGTGWPQVEPQEGRFDWTALDRQMAYLDSQGMRYGGVLSGNPKWSHGALPWGLPVNNLPGWSRYVGETVKHCKGRIKCWEVWNEPPNFTAKGQTPADYARIVVAAYDAAKAADPNALIGLATKSVHINYLDQVIQAGAKGHFDFVTLHPYETAGRVLTHPGSELVYLQVAGTTRKMLAARDPAKVNCPIIITELGAAAGGQWAVKVPGFSPPEGQAHAVVKYYAMSIAQGIACMQWFEARDGDSGPMGLLDAKGQPRPAYTALAQMVRYFGRHPTYLGWVLLNDKHFGFVFAGADGPVMATWAGTTAPDTVDFGRPVQIVDPLTGNVTTAASRRLTVAPILLHGVPDNLVRQAKANKGKPFPWGGDYSNAKSVSVTMGEKNIEKGLHTGSGEEVAAAVVAYGGGARAGDVPGGNVFTVDPNFLSYDAVPIEISVVCRRQQNDAPVSLTLEYEAGTPDGSGYKKLPPVEIPAGDGWSTVRWRLDDARFVNMWGFNFRYNTGKYHVRSVTVTKLGK